MKKLVAVIVLGVVFTSCGSHPCPAYTSDNYENSKELKKNIIDESVDTRWIQEI